MKQTTITKSIRLSPDESQLVAQLSEQTAITEATLMKRWIVEGIRTQKLELAIQSYSQRKVDLRGGAAMAGVDYMYFTQAVQTCNIVVLEDSHFTDQLAFLAQAFNDQTLQQAVDQLRAQVL